MVARSTLVFGALGFAKPRALLHYFELLHRVFFPADGPRLAVPPSAASRSSLAAEQCSNLAGFGTPKSVPLPRPESPIGNPAYSAYVQ